MLTCWQHRKQIKFTLQTYLQISKREPIFCVCFCKLLIACFGLPCNCIDVLAMLSIKLLDWNLTSSDVGNAFSKPRRFSKPISWARHSCIRVMMSDFPPLNCFSSIFILRLLLLSNRLNCKGIGIKNLTFSQL